MPELPRQRATIFPAQDHIGEEKINFGAVPLPDFYGFSGVDCGQDYVAGRDQDLPRHLAHKGFVFYQQYGCGNSSLRGLGKTRNVVGDLSRMCTHTLARSLLP